MDPSEIAELKEARRASLVDKWASGKKLTDEESDEIKDLISQPKRKARAAFARNKVEACRMLGIDRPTFDRVLKTPGCPPRSANGKYNTTSITEFMGTAGFRAGVAIRQDDLASDKRKKARYEALMAQLDYEKAVKHLVPIEMVERVVGDVLESMRNVLKETPDLTDELKQALLKKLATVGRETYFEEPADEVN